MPDPKKPILPPSGAAGKPSSPQTTAPKPTPQIAKPSQPPSAKPIPKSPGNQALVPTVSKPIAKIDQRAAPSTRLLKPAPPGSKVGALSKTSGKTTPPKDTPLDQEASVAYLRKLIQEDPKLIASLLKKWINPNE